MLSESKLFDTDFNKILRQRKYFETQHSETSTKKSLWKAKKINIKSNDLLTRTKCKQSHIMLEKKYSVSNVVFNFSLELKLALEKSAYFDMLNFKNCMHQRRINFASLNKFNSLKIFTTVLEK